MVCRKVVILHLGGVVTAYDPSGGKKIRTWSFVEGPSEVC